MTLNWIKAGGPGWRSSKRRTKQFLKRVASKAGNTMSKSRKKTSRTVLIPGSQILEKTKLRDATLSQYAMAVRSADHDSLRENEIRQFFDGENYISTMQNAVSPYSHNKLQYVWEEFIKQEKMKVVLETNYGYLEKTPPERVQIEIQPGQFKSVYSEVTLLMKTPTGKMALHIYFNDHSSCYSYSFYHLENTESPWKKWFDLSNEKNFYRGQKIDAACRFLEIKDSTWDEVILTDEKKNFISSSVDNILKNINEFKEFGISIKRGIILHGDPGTGKTQICRAIARQVNCSVLYVLPRDFSSDKGGVKRLAGMAKDLAPCVLIIEDIDFIASDRNLGSSGMVIELMNYLDGLEYFGDIITVATTNHISIIENAVKNRPGRFDRIVEIGKPEKNEREKMIRSFTKKFNIRDLENKGQISKISEHTDSLSGAHIKDLCNTAAMNAVHSKSIEIVDGKRTLVLKMKHFQDAIKEVSKKDFSTYAEQQSQGKFGFNSRKDTSLEELLAGEDSLL